MGVPPPAESARSLISSESRDVRIRGRSSDNFPTSVGGSNPAGGFEICRLALGPPFPLGAGAVRLSILL